MINSLKKILGLGQTVDYAKLVKEGAIILDVRSKSEYSNGHIKGSLNISLDQLAHNLHRLSDKQKPVITCCASGMRSGSAASMLKNKGYSNVFNGGGWSSLKNKI